MCRYPFEKHIEYMDVQSNFTICSSFQLIVSPTGNVGKALHSTLGVQEKNAPHNRITHLCWAIGFREQRVDSTVSKKIGRGAMTAGVIGSAAGGRMARNVGRRPLTPVSLPRQRHGHKRKGKPVEAWKMDLEQDENSEERRVRGVNLNAIEQIADGVERMMFSWNMDTFERSQERAKIPNMDVLSCPRNVFGENLHSHESPRAPNAYPLQARRDQVTESSVVDSRADSRAFEVLGNPSVVIRQERMTGGGSVVEVRRGGSFEISTCEKNVGTEGKASQAMAAEYSPRMSLWGPTPSPDADTLPPTPPCCPIQHDSCPLHLPDHHLHVSLRKDGGHSSTLTHSRSETEPATCELHSRRANSSGFPAYSVSRCCSDYFALHPLRQARAMATQLEVGGRPVTMPVLGSSSEALQRKFESLIHMTSGAPLCQGKERACSAPPPEISSVEELQLALIECATEYEIKTLDARMKMLRAYKRQAASDQPAEPQENRNHDEMPMSYGVIKRLEPKIAQQQVKKHVMRPEEMKENIKRPDNQPWKKKERSSLELEKSESGVRAFSRLFDRQRRSLDDALHRVDRLQREVVRKDRELVEWQLKEKETKAQLHGLEEKVKRSQASPKPPEPRKLLMELPALRESLRSLKAEERKQISSPPTESVQELSDIKSMSEMSDRDCSVNSRLQFLEERVSEMDELKLTMSKLAANMAELSVAFKDHVQFVNHRLGAIHGLVSQKRPPVRTRNSPDLVQPYVPQRNALAQLQLAGVDTVEAEREVTRSPRPSPPPSWQR